MKRSKGIYVLAAVLALGGGVSAATAASASAKRLIRVYEPMQPELVTPAPATLEDPTFQNPEVEGGFLFRVGKPSNQVEAAECAGGFSGDLETNNQYKDELRLMSGWIGSSGSCEGQFGTPRITLGGFPLAVLLSSTGKVQVRGSLEVSVEGGPGVPPMCIYKGKVVVPGKVPAAGALIMNMKGKLKSPTNGCLQLFFVTDGGESGAMMGYGADEALYTSVF